MFKHKFSKDKNQIESSMSAVLDVGENLYGAA